MDKFLEPFRKQATGLQALQEFADMNSGEAGKKCSNYIKDVQAKKLRYHSMDAAALAAKAATVFEITSSNLDSISTVAEMMGVRVPAHHCLSRHPGLRRTRDAGRILQAQKLIQMFPKESSVVKCEARRGRVKKIIYAKITIGLGLAHCFQDGPTKTRMTGSSC